MFRKANKALMADEILKKSNFFVAFIDDQKLGHAVFPTQHVQLASQRVKFLSKGRSPNLALDLDVDFHHI